MDVLRQIRGDQMVQKLELGPVRQDKGFVFTKPDGGPLDPEVVTRVFGKAVRAAGFKGIRLHDLRHTHTSLMLNLYFPDRLKP